MAPLLQRLSRSSSSSRKDREPASSTTSSNAALVSASASASASSFGPSLTSRLLTKGRSSIKPSASRSANSNNSSSSKGKPPPVPSQKPKNKAGAEQARGGKKGDEKKSKKNRRKDAAATGTKSSRNNNDNCSPDRDYLSSTMLDLLHDVSLYVKEHDDGSTEVVSDGASGAGQVSSPSTAATAPPSPLLDTIDRPPKSGGRSDKKKSSPPPPPPKTFFNDNDPLGLNRFFHHNTTPADSVLPAVLSGTISAIPRGADDTDVDLSLTKATNEATDDIDADESALPIVVGGNVAAAAAAAAADKYAVHLARPRSLRDEFDDCAADTSTLSLATSQFYNVDSEFARSRTDGTTNGAPNGSSAAVATKNANTRSLDLPTHPRRSSPTNTVRPHEFSPLDEIKSDGNVIRISHVTSVQQTTNQSEHQTKANVLWGCKKCDTKFKSKATALRHESRCNHAINRSGLNTTDDDQDLTMDQERSGSSESYEYSFEDSSEWEEGDDDKIYFYDELMDALCCDLTTPTFRRRASSDPGYR